MNRYIALVIALFVSSHALADVTFGVKRTSHVTVIPAKPNFNDTEDSLGGTVSRSTLTRAVVNHEPVDNITSVTSLQHIYFFTELKGFMGEKVFHRWVHNGEVVKQEEFEVGGPRWRVWSSATILPNLLGEWKVYVVDMTGKIIREAIFDYTPKF